MNREPNRQELDPTDSTEPRNEIIEGVSTGIGNGLGTSIDVDGITPRLDELIAEVGGEPGSFDAKLVRDLLLAGLKLIPDGRDTGELKLMTAAMKELRYAYHIFAKYAKPHKVTIFGSARTPAGHDDYEQAVVFSRLMAEAGWMVITGAGGGIMEAGHVGPGREKSFGVAIRLPFETTANEVIAGDAKLIHFRYFFTRKLMFMSQAEAITLFPGGFGTMDEAFEALTLIQTGKASMIPVVMLEGDNSSYWEQWAAFIRGELLSAKLINEEDLDLFYVAKSPEDGVKHITGFYKNYHSSRYVRDDLVIRLKRRLRDEDVAALNDEFAVLVKSGSIVQRGPYDEEQDHLDMPRITFTHTRHQFGLVRRLIDRINSFTGED
jgi:uncharacterized protein (TIGR00730 family)